jgi:hypothetical protein
MQAAMKLALEANFGSLTAWQDALIALVATPAAGSVALCFSPDKGTLRHCAAADINNHVVLWQCNASDTQTPDVVAGIDAWQAAGKPLAVKPAPEGLAS